MPRKKLQLRCDARMLHFAFPLSDSKLQRYIKTRQLFCGGTCVTFTVQQPEMCVNHQPPVKFLVSCVSPHNSRHKHRTHNPATVSLPLSVQHCRVHTYDLTK